MKLMVTQITAIKDVIAFLSNTPEHIIKKDMSFWLLSQITFKKTLMVDVTDLHVANF